MEFIIQFNFENRSDKRCINTIILGFYLHMSGIFISVYHVGSEYGWSPIFTFKALAERSDGGFIYAVYGDLGNENARSLGKIQKEAQLGLIDVVLHIGQ